MNKQEIHADDSRAAVKRSRGMLVAIRLLHTTARNLLARTFQHPAISRLTRALAANREAGIRSRAMAADIWANGRTRAPDRFTGSEVTTSIRSRSQNPWGDD